VNSDLKEKFLDILPSHLTLVLLRFRCMNHKLPVESGRFCYILVTRELSVTYAILAHLVMNIITYLIVNSLILIEKIYY
jgi:hypothetical protein